MAQSRGQFFKSRGIKRQAFYPVTGFAELDKQLRELPGALANRISTAAMKKAMTPIYEQSLAAVPVGDTSAYISSLVIRPKSKKGKKWLLVGVRPKPRGVIKETKAGNRSFYPAAVEYGVKGTRRKPGRHLDIVAERLGPGALKEAERQLFYGVQRELLKNARKAGATSYTVGRFNKSL